MKVRAIRDCATKAGFHPAGAVFDYEGPKNRHLVPVVEEAVAPSPMPPKVLPRGTPLMAAEPVEPDAPAVQEAACEESPPVTEGKREKPSGKGWRKTAKG